MNKALNYILKPHHFYGYNINKIRKQDNIKRTLD